MKQLTAILTATAILFSLSAAAWAEGEDAAPAAEAAPALLASPDAPAEGFINPAGETVSENQIGVVMNINDGTVGTNRGTVEVNNGTVNVNALNGTVITNNGTVGLSTNNGIVVTNNGTVPRNSPYGTVTENNGTITTNAGTLETNTKNGTVVTNDSDGTVETNKGTVVTNDGTVTENGFWDGYTYSGTVTINNGTVELNNGNGTVETNNGTIEANDRTVALNSAQGTVTENNGLVQTNAGLVETNNAHVQLNEGTVQTNARLVETNNGTVGTNNNYIVANWGTVIVNNGTIDRINGLGEVTFNSGKVKYADTPDKVKYNAGEVDKDFFNTEKGNYEHQSWFGVVYANEAGEGLLLPQGVAEQGVAEQLLADTQNAESILAGLVHSGDLVFAQAHTDSSDPAVNGELTLLTEDDVSFENPGYTLNGWLDANNDNAEYALGQTVTVTAPLWLIPNWVLIPVPSPAVVVETSTSTSAPQVTEVGYYLLVPATAVQAEARDFSNVTISSSDPRVTKDSVLPTAALRLSADLANAIRSWPLQIEFDGEFLPSGSYSLSFHQDGTVTLLLSRTFLSTVAGGEHEITLWLHDAAIDVTILLTEPEPQETTLRARTVQLSGGLSQKNQSGNNAKKGMSG